MESNKKHLCVHGKKFDHSSWLEKPLSMYKVLYTQRKNKSRKLRIFFIISSVRTRVLRVGYCLCWDVLAFQHIINNHKKCTP